MKLVSWNVNGLRAVCGKGFADIFAGFDADFVCLQETKLNPDVPEINYEGYQSFWNYAERKGYSGTAVFTRRKVINVTKGIGVDVHDREGRVITVETDGFYLICVYTPNSQNELARLDYRMEWEEAFLDYVRGLDRVKPVCHGFLTPASSTRSDTCIPTPATPTVGGATVAAPVRRTWGGVSTTSSSRSASRRCSPTRQSSPTLQARTTVR